MVRLPSESMSNLAKMALSWLSCSTCNEGISITTMTQILNVHKMRKGMGGGGGGGRGRGGGGGGGGGVVVVVWFVLFFFGEMVVGVLGGE